MPGYAARLNRADGAVEWLNFRRLSRKEEGNCNLGAIPYLLDGEWASVAACVGLTGNQHSRGFGLRSAAKGIQNTIHQPARRPDAQPERRDHGQKKNQSCHQHVQVRPAF